MAAYLIRRLVANGADLLGVVLLVFFLFKYFGGDPAEILGGLNATPEQIAAIRQQLGLDEPVGAAGHLPQADRHLRLGQELGHQRGGEQPVRHPAAGHADGDAADPRARHPAGAADRDVGGLPCAAR
jgi:hypothetical protein